MIPTSLKSILLTIFLLIPISEAWAACDEPSNLQVSNITTQQAMVNWDPVAGAVSYKLAYRLRNNNRWIQVVTISDTTFTIEGLGTGTPYQWGVKTNCDSTQSSFIFGDEFMTAGMAACEIPSNLQATSLTANSVNLQWDVANGNTNYRLIYWKRDALGSNTEPSDNFSSVETGNNSITLNDLQSGTTYFWGIRNVCENIPLESNLTQFEQFTTLGTIRCVDPQNLKATYLSSTLIELSCDTAYGATQYRFAIKKTSDNDWTEIMNITDNKVQVRVDQTSDYEWGVRSLCPNDATVSAFMNGNSFSTQSTCNSPVGLTSTMRRRNGTVRLNWQRINGASQYILHYRIVGTSGWSELSVNNNRVTLQGLARNSNYEWQVQTVCGASNSTVSLFSNLAYFNTSCGTPGNLRYSIRGNSQVNLRWNSVNGAGTYLVQYREIGQNSWLEVTTRSNRIRLNNIPEDITYEWRVQATCSNQSYFSPISQFSIPRTNSPPIARSANLISTTNSTAVTQPAASLTAYPNPAIDYMLVTLDEVNIGATAFLFNSFGELVLKQPIFNKSGVLDLTSLQTGVYMLDVVSGGTTLRQKVIVNKSLSRFR